MNEHRAWEGNLEPYTVDEYVQQRRPVMIRCRDPYRDSYYAYTLGRTEHGLAELAVQDTSADVACWLLAFFIRMIGPDQQAAGRITMYEPPGNQVTILVDTVAEDLYAELFTEGVERYGLDGFTVMLCHRE